jgi:hypothetical protein
MTFFGNAPSQHMAYDAWNNRDLPFITNNQAGCLVVNFDWDSISLYVTHLPYAKQRNP